jgi:hypothetical protein
MPLHPHLKDVTACSFSKHRGGLTWRGAKYFPMTGELSRLDRFLVSLPRSKQAWPESPSNSRSPSIEVSEGRLCIDVE